MARRKKQDIEETVSEVSLADVTEEVIPVSAAAGHADINSKFDMMQQQINMLTQTLLLERQNAKTIKDSDDATIGITRVSGSKMVMELTDAYGRKKSFAWENVGDTQYLTLSQYEEFQESRGAQKFVSRGYLLPEGDAASFITPEKFITVTALEDLPDLIESITDSGKLIEILNYIEGVRIETEDPSTGRPHLDLDGKPQANVLKMDTKTRLVASMCADKLFTMTGVKYSLNDG
jgi:hypothetical protein